MSCHVMSCFLLARLIPLLAVGRRERAWCSAVRVLWYCGRCNVLLGYLLFSTALVDIRDQFPGSIWAEVALECK